MAERIYYIIRFVGTYTYIDGDVLAAELEIGLKILAIYFLGLTFLRKCRMMLFCFLLLVYLFIDFFVEATVVDFV